MSMTLQQIVQEETEWMFGDIGEGHGIGSSDISACVRQVLDTCLLYTSPSPRDRG